MVDGEADPACVGVDGRVFSQPVTGIGRYVFEVARELHRELPFTVFKVYSQQALALPLPAQWQVVVEPDRRLRKINSFVWFRWFSPRLLKLDQPDAYWANAGFVPVLPRQIPVVAMVYDLVYKLFPHTMRRKTAWQYRLFFERDLRRTDRVLALSSGTARRVESTLGIAGLRVALPGVREPFEPVPHERIVAAREQHSLYGPYLLTVATLEPRKNLVGLVKAWRQLKVRDAALLNLELVLIGGRGWRDARLRALLEDVANVGVRTLGRIDDETLAALYAGAAAVVVPSLYEGFGLPALEARACGARLVCSDLPELREAGGPEAIYVPPTPEGLSDGIAAAVSGRRRAREEDLPGWDVPSRVLADALREVARCRRTI